MSFMLRTHVTRDIIFLSFMCDPLIAIYIIETWHNLQFSKLFKPCKKWGSLCPKSILVPRAPSLKLARWSIKIDIKYFVRFLLHYWIVCLLHCNNIIEQKLQQQLTTWPWDPFPYQSCVTHHVTAVLSTCTWHTICFLSHYSMMRYIVTADSKFGSKHSNNNNDLSVQGVSSGDENMSS